MCVCRQAIEHGRGADCGARAGVPGGRIHRAEPRGRLRPHVPRVRRQSPEVPQQDPLAAIAYVPHELRRALSAVAFIYEINAAAGVQRAETLGVLAARKSLQLVIGSFARRGSRAR